MSDRTKGNRPEPQPTKNHENGGRTTKLVSGLTKDILHHVLEASSHLRPESVLVLVDLERDASATFACQNGLCDAEEVRQMRSNRSSGSTPFLLLSRHPHLAADLMVKMPPLTSEIKPLRQPRAGCVRVIVISATEDHHLDVEDFDVPFTPVGTRQPIHFGQNRLEYDN